MKVEPGEDIAAPSAVRVELYDGAETAAPLATTAARLDGGPKRWPALAMAAAVLAVLGGLVWLSSIESTAPEAADELRQINPAPAITADDAIDEGEEGDAVESVITLLSLPLSPTHVIGFNDELVLGGPKESDDEIIDVIGSQTPIARTLDGLQWHFGGAGGDTSATLRIVGLEAEDAGVRVFVARPHVSGVRTELVVFDAGVSRDDEWLEAAVFPIDGHVRSVSSRHGQWVAVVDRRAQSTAATPPMHTLLVTGRIAQEEPKPSRTFHSVQVAPDEFVSSYAAVADGFLAIVVRPQLSGLADDAPAPELRRWTPDDEWEVLPVDLTIEPGDAPARLIDAGRSGLFLSSAKRLVSIDASVAVADWPEVVDGRGVTGLLDNGYSPEVAPAMVGDGFLIADNVVADVETVWISTDGVLWQRFHIDTPFRSLKLLKITENGVALVAGEANGQPALARLELSREPASTQAFEPDVLRRFVTDGEWSTPVFSAADVEGPGFVGLANINGQIALLDSPNGFDVVAEEPTDFPFGYFTNNMKTTSAGYHVVGKLGFFNDAVFTSDDGIAWERFEIERPFTATALQIDHFHRTATTAALSGSLGWADDLSRTELVAMWWDSSGTSHLVPARPCENTVIACTITSLAATSDGLLAAHGFGGQSAVSRWTLERGWSTTLNLNLPNSRLTSTDIDEIVVLAQDDLLFSANGGITWVALVSSPSQTAGRFIGVHEPTGTAVFESDSELWLAAAGRWIRFAKGELEIGNVLAVTDGVALFSGSLPTGPVVIRLVAPDAS